VTRCRGAQNNPRVAGVGDAMRSPSLKMDSATTVPELAEHNDACGHVVLLPEVELTVTKLLLVVDERRQRERLLPVVFVRGFQVRNMDSSLTLVYENDSQVRSIEKILQRINVTHIKRNLS
jgi:hypothetical protein